ncbi:hypothetical protein HHL03_19030 [Acinetobacter pittii]|nr:MULTISPECIES: hypothetical protein [Acinetobacter calcoaceticus/baumannii complex]EXG29982.1 hypothetical protein J733_3118 [Acinetobacter sp. 263903-2]MCG9523266.1 hypothetical protein [Acinetobacter pittii]NMI11592.1 hypothetical protein [Acinetobacter pittii]QRP67260.1 hypothetical protein I6J44_17615 [Acinetobacter pittii]WQD15791.1 hypothetical protein U0544_19930 [Acinetobacter pittii]
MSEFEMAYFDVKLFISKWTTGVIYKGLYIEMDESSTFAYKVFDNENCGEELCGFLSMNDAIEYIDEVKAESKEAN